MLKKIVLAGVAFIYFSGCATQPRPPSQVKKETAFVIEGRKWRLMSFGNHRMKVPQRAWILLEKGRYQGFAGCNGLSGTYEMRGKNIRFTMDPSTQMACVDMRGETAFKKRLLQVDRYEMKDGMLLFSGGKERVLVFVPSRQRKGE
ncbi:META domain-containing protein [Hydrogenimonas urashimensis]|uniref:META domain-containing protein n=1 Tax=Hydrogenimonas urashimensis TaxID=2740515 RepID=UPI0019150E48|nr:META domain-containing protein [Hydrogenimonas urashimensis]